MKTLCGMTTDELASSHLKEERKRIRDESYAGHMRPEDEGNEIVYKDGALQKIDKVKSEAKKQGNVVTSDAIASKIKVVKKARGAGSGSSGGGGSGTGGGAMIAVKTDEDGVGGGGVGGGGGSGTEEGKGAVGKKPGVGKGVGGDGDEEDDGEEEEEEEEDNQKGSTSGRLVRLEVKRRLSGSSDLGGGEGGEGDGWDGAVKRIKTSGSPNIDDVPK